MKYIFALLLALVTAAANAQTIGVAYYGVQKFTQAQCAEALAAFDGVEYPAMSVLWGTFGKDTSCIRSFLQRFGKVPHTLVIHTTNETCRRAPRHCGSGEIAKDLRFWQYNDAIERDDPFIHAELRNRFREIGAFLKKYKTIHSSIVLTTGLEDQFTDKAYKRIFKILRRNAKYPTARNPVGHSANAYRASFIELHGADARFPESKPCLWSNDGIDIDFNSGRRPLNGADSVPELLGQLRKHKRNCSYNFIWWNTQGIVDGQFIEPRGRTIRIYPKDVSVVNEILKGKLK